MPKNIEIQIVDMAQAVRGINDIGSASTKLAQKARATYAAILHYMADAGVDGPTLFERFAESHAKEVAAWESETEKKFSQSACGQKGAPPCGAYWNSFRTYLSACEKVGDIPKVEKGQLFVKPSPQGRSLANAGLAFLVEPVKKEQPEGGKVEIPATMEGALSDISNEDAPGSTNVAEGGVRVGLPVATDLEAIIARDGEALIRILIEMFDEETTLADMLTAFTE